MYQELLLQMILFLLYLLLLHLLLLQLLLLFVPVRLHLADPVVDKVSNGREDLLILVDLADLDEGERDVADEVEVAEGLHGGAAEALPLDGGFLVDLATGKLWLDSQSGILVSGTSQDGIYEIKLRVSPAAIAGTYTLWLSRGDTLGNKTFEPATKDGAPITFTIVK